MRRGLIFGIGLWALITVAFKLVVDGDIVTFDGAQLRVFLPVAGAVIAVTAAAVMRLACAPGNATRFGLGLAIPGMLLSNAALLAFGHLVARPSMEHGIVYAIFILWTYGLILAAIALFGERMTGSQGRYGVFEQTPFEK